VVLVSNRIEACATPAISCRRIAGSEGFEAGVLMGMDLDQHSQARHGMKPQSRLGHLQHGGESWMPRR